MAPSGAETVNLSPFLLFEGNCAEAMRSYQACLGGQLEVTLLRETLTNDQPPATFDDKGRLPAITRIQEH